MTVVIDTSTAEEVIQARRETRARRKRLMRRARGCCVWFVAIAVSAGVGMWIFVTAFVYADQRAGERALAQARAGGAPLTQAEFGTISPRSPAIDETTRRWRKAIEHVDVSAFQHPEFSKVPVIGMSRADDGDDPPDRDDRGRLRGEDLVEATQFVARFREALAAARTARDSGDVANFSGTADPASGIYFHAYSLVYLSLVLRLRTEIRLANGDADGALDDLSTMLAAGDALRYEPYDWMQRGRHQTLESAVDLIERLLAVEALDDDQLERLASEFSDRDEAESFRVALAGSRIGFVDMLQRDDEALKGMLRIERSKWTRGADLSRGLDIFRRMEEASERGLREAVDAWKPIEAELAALGGEPAAQVRYPGTLMLIPSFGEQAQSHLQADARVAVARTAIACERYRLARGELPAKLEDLAPDFLSKPPVDPGDGKPLRYVNDASGVRLYSVGADGVDDGGGAAASSGAAMFAPSDVVLRLKKTKPNAEASAAP